MIKVKIGRDTRGVVQEITITGHAGQGPYGHDIVCAAVSALSETLVLGLTRIAPITMDYHLDEGDLSMVFHEDPSEAAQAIIDTFCLGLQDLANTEPKFVQYHEHTINRHRSRGRD
ncbi:ribosomal-processing cysteine protease Prp [Sulfobacillus thermosulfidooxidans]|uniref:ribosomal-processing cysteine protease Prp n=1 Tax=Sulfobacillus thermosulfidooxidans TaxID=28034 RepID=UPI0009E74E90|nr:ribosomal-processing cysteine protease Prp [Sulfobacillus thermosulfidooxidans]